MKSRKFSRQQENLSPDATPLCPFCFTPCAEAEKYCTKCGEMIGPWAAYLPIESIRFRMDFVRRMWHKLWYGRSDWFGQKALILLVLLGVIPFAFIGLPFVLWRKLRIKHVSRDQP